MKVRYFRNQIRVVVFVLAYSSGFVGCALVVKSKYLLQVFLMLDAVIYLLVISPMVSRYFFYITHNVTEKEFVSRKQACSTYRLIDEYQNKLSCR
mmetsp:Transcript_33071/g.32199  ORF Transcript_33071/g.32199 Transcript_33071/m.32199 type:complete len:95 (+) Transcript_33071:708-992(+)